MRIATPLRPRWLGRVQFGIRVPLPEEDRYAEFFGSLLYLANQKRPDIAFIVSRLARCIARATEGDWAIARRVVRYLKGNSTMGIKYGGAKALGVWVDSDFAGDLETRKSTTGFVFTLHGGAVSWCSRLQRLVATSTTTAEYSAAAEGVNESMWIRRIVGGVGEDARPVTLREDN